MSLNEDMSRRVLIDAPHFQPDNTIFNQVKNTHSMFSPQFIQFVDDLFPWEVLSVDGERFSFFKSYGNELRFIRSIFRCIAPFQDVLQRRNQFRILNFTPFPGVCPHVFIIRVGALFGLLYRNTVFVSISNFLFPAHSPFTYRRDDFEFRIQRGDVALKPDLIISLSGTAVRDHLTAILFGNLYSYLRNNSPPQRAYNVLTYMIVRLSYACCYA